MFLACEASVFVAACSDPRDRPGLLVRRPAKSGPSAFSRATGRAGTTLARATRLGTPTVSRRVKRGSQPPKGEAVNSARGGCAQPPASTFLVCSERANRGAPMRRGHTGLASHQSGTGPRRAPFLVDLGLQLVAEVRRPLRRERRTPPGALRERACSARLLLAGGSPSPRPEEPSGRARWHIVGSGSPRRARNSADYARPWP